MIILLFYRLGLRRTGGTGDYLCLSMTWCVGLWVKKNGGVKEGSDMDKGL